MLVSRETQYRALNQPNKGRKLVAIAAVSVLFVIALCFGGYEVLSHSRYQVVGDTDPRTGYQIEYTVSAQYRMIEAPRLDWRATGRSLSFSPKPPPKALSWFYTHILRRQTAPSRRSFYGWQQDTINHYYFKGEVPPGITVDAHGYPRLTNTRNSMSITLEEHVLIAGCPATWTVLKLPGSTAPNICFYILLVKRRDLQAIYAFSSIDNSVQPTGVANEILKIRDSLRIVKAK